MIERRRGGEEEKRGRVSEREREREKERERGHHFQSIPTICILWHPIGSIHAWRSIISAFSYVQYCHRESQQWWYNNREKIIIILLLGCIWRVYCECTSP